MTTSLSSRRPLSVLVISPHPQILGGQTHFVETMKAHLSGHKIVPLYVGRKTARGFFLYRAFTTLLRLIYVPLRAGWLVRFTRIDVVHLNPVFNPQSLIREGLVLLMLRCMGVRNIMVYFHGWQKPMERLLAASTWRRRLFVKLMNDAGPIMVLAPEFKAALVQMGIDQNKIHVTRTMFDGSVLRHYGNGSASTDNKRKIILFLARFDRLKGVYELLEAFRHIASDYPDIDLVMAGDGPDSKAIKAKAASYNLDDRISFPGYVRGAQKAALLHRCDLFVLPTYYPEGMPIALLEAMACGKAILTARVGGIEHIFSEPENGVLLDAVTVATVEAGLRFLLANPALCQEMGQRNLQYAWEHFEAKAMTAKIEDLYYQLVQLNEG